MAKRENEGFFYRRLIRPILDLLRQGVTPEKIALSVALGVALGIFPLLGSTTILCALAALALRLNLPAIQIVNYFVYPLQIALLLPFLRAGEWLFGAPRLRLTAQQIYARIQAGLPGAIAELWTPLWHAIIAWCLAAPVFVGVAYFVLAPMLRRVARRKLDRPEAAL
jgi:uncharacterized protein (DUF2062 family)